MKKLLIFLGAFLVLATTVSANPGGLEETIDNLDGLLEAVRNFIFALAFIAFIWGMMMWIFQSGEKQDKGKNVAIYGGLALLIMFSIWGILSVVQGTFGIGEGTVTTPGLPS